MAMSVCNYCGKQFETKSTGKYCPDCTTSGVSVACCVCGLPVIVPVKTYVRELASNPDKARKHKKCSAEFRRNMWTDEMRKTMADKVKERREDTEYCEMVRQKHTEAHQTPEYRAKMSVLATQRMADPSNREVLSASLTELYATAEGKAIRAQISDSLKQYNTQEGVKEANSERLKAFFESEAGKEQSKQHSENRRVFFLTDEGIAERERMAERQKAFCATPEGKVTVQIVQQKLAAFRNTPAGLAVRERQSKVMRLHYQTDEGTRTLAKLCRGRKVAQIARAESKLNLNNMRRYWEGLSDADLLAKHKEYLLHTLEYDFWVELSEYLYSKFGRCSRRDLSKATGVLYGTVVWSLKSVGVPSLVKEYRKELEDEVCSFVKQVYSGTVVQRLKPDFLLNENGNRMELDIYIPDKNLAIEVNGTYWHSEEGGKDKNYHYDKSRLCRENGIRLIHVWEHEWNNERQRPILESIIKAALGITESVSASELAVEYRPAADMREFFETNDIHGFSYGEFAACLVDGSGEVIMGYLLGKGHDWEVVRGASKLGVTVVGGSDKLLSAIFNDKQLDSIAYTIDYTYFDVLSLLQDTTGWTQVSEQISYKNYCVKKDTESILWGAGIATYVYKKNTTTP